MPLRIITTHGEQIVHCGLMHPVFYTVPGGLNNTGIIDVAQALYGSDLLRSSPLGRAQPYPGDDSQLVAAEGGAMTIQPCQTYSCQDVTLRGAHREEEGREGHNTRVVSASTATDMPRLRSSKM